MAIIDKNIFVNGLHGRFGKHIVFRQFNGKIVVSKAPEFSREPSPAQAEIRNKFARAIQYGKTALLDPALKAEYKAIAQAKKLTSATVAAISDFRKPTRLESIFVVQDAPAGRGMYVILEDNYKGKEMMICFYDKEGAVIENGAATFTFGDHGWFYVSTKTAYSRGIKIVVTVKDRPGNVVSFEHVI
jgi:hypothetical protein